jgi:putative flippase GtrA
MKETIGDMALQEVSLFPSSTEESRRTYQLTRWPLINRALDVVDRRAGGKAGYVQRLFHYLFFGGLAALINLLVFGVIFSLLRFPSGVSTQMRNVLASVGAAECSIMVNFLLNDRFTFRHLPGARRPWLQRCLRFHATCIVGALLTFVLEFALFSLAHMPALYAEMIAIVIVLGYNFTCHHYFTYRTASAPSGVSLK